MSSIPWCIFIRRADDWRKCVYKGGYCQYWKECVEIWDIRSFAERKLQLLYEKYLKRKENAKKELEEKPQAEVRKNRKLSEFLS